MTDRAEAAAVEPMTDTEAAAWADLEKEVGADDTVEGEAPQADAKAETEAEPAKDDAAKDEKPAEKLPYEEIEKRHRQLQGALGEERAARKAAQERAAQMQAVFEQIRAARAQQQQPGMVEPAQQAKPPTIEEDPIGYFQHQIAEQARVIDELRNGSRQTVEQVQRAQVEQQFWTTVERSEQAIRQANPDYDPAVTFLETSRVRELETMLPDTPQADQYAMQQGYQSAEAMRVAMLNQDRINVAKQALSLGMSPAELYYNLALQRGYKAAVQAAPTLKKPTAQSTPIEAARKGQAAAKSLSGGGGSSNNAMSIDDLADLYLEDPDRADREFKRLKASGALG